MGVDVTARSCNGAFMQDNRPFLAVSLKSGEQRLINWHQVAMIRPTQDDHALLVFRNSHEVEVIETYAELRKRVAL